jgi:hypothetical protein
MKLLTIATGLLPLVSAARYSKEQYDSGEVMAKMMEAKEVLHLSISRRLIALAC